MHTRSAIVTGASSGVGRYGTKSLGAQGLHVVMTCRDPAKWERAVASLGVHRRGVTAQRLDRA
jgi:protochlorophyllide reductase